MNSEVICKEVREYNLKFIIEKLEDYSPAIQQQIVKLISLCILQPPDPKSARNNLQTSEGIAGPIGNLLS